MTNSTLEQELVQARKLVHQKIRTLRLMAIESFIVSMAMLTVTALRFFFGIFPFNAVLALSLATFVYAIIGRWRFQRHRRECKTALERIDVLKEVVSTTRG